jgi:hypothetical protein
MEGTMQIALGDRLRVASCAIRAAYSNHRLPRTPQDILGLYAGLKGTLVPGIRIDL